MSSTATRLRDVRLAKNLTYSELARAAGILNRRDKPARQTIFNIETGRQPASVEQIEKLAAALGISPAWLAFGTKENEK